MGVGSDRLKRDLSRNQDTKVQKTISLLSVVFLCLITFSIGVVVSPMLSTAVQLEQEDTRLALSNDQTLLEAQNRISQDEIKVYNDRVQIDKQNVKFAPVGATSSMLPFLHSGAHSLEVEPESEEDLKVGDIISFYVPEEDTFIIHTIISIGADENGWFATTKGHNNPVADPWQVRFDQIEGVLVGVLY